MGSPDQPAALGEGRRIYLGNLLYIVRPIEIEDMLKNNDLGGFEKTHITIGRLCKRQESWLLFCRLRRPRRCRTSPLIPPRHDLRSVSKGWALRAEEAQREGLEGCAGSGRRQMG